MLNDDAVVSWAIYRAKQVMSNWMDLKLCGLDVARCVSPFTMGKLKKMNMTQSLQLIICTFDGADKADEVRKAIEVLDAKLDTIKLGNIAVVKKDQAGQIVFHETRERPVEAVGTLAGTVVQGVTWLLYNVAGMLGPIAGPLAGQETRVLIHTLGPDLGFPNDALLAIGAQLDAGRSALITLVKPEEYPIVVDELQRLGGERVEHLVPAEVVARLSEEAA